MAYTNWNDNLVSASFFASISFFFLEKKKTQSKRMLKNGSHFTHPNNEEKDIFRGKWNEFKKQNTWISEFTSGLQRVNEKNYESTKRKKEKSYLFWYFFIKIYRRPECHFIFMFLVCVVCVCVGAWVSQSWVYQSFNFHSLFVVHATFNRIEWKWITSNTLDMPIYHFRFNKIMISLVVFGSDYILV